MIRKVLVCLFSFILLLVSFSPVIAQSKFADADQGQIDEAIQRLTPIRFLPDSPLHSLIGFKEFFSRAFQPSSSKRAAFDLVLAGKRLKEGYSLAQKEDFVGAGNSVSRYSVRIRKVVDGFEKARSQNQDVVELTNNIAVDLKYHEWLLFAIEKKTYESGYDSLGPNLDRAAEKFALAVAAIENVHPGIKTRYKAATSAALLQEIKVEPTSTPTPALLFATPKTQPRKIIY